MDVLQIRKQTFIDAVGARDVICGEMCWEEPTHPSYSPDLTPANESLDGIKFENNGAELQQRLKFLCSTDKVFSAAGFT